MKKIISILAIMIIALTGMSQTYSNTNTGISESNTATITIDSNIVSFDAIYTPFTLFSSPIEVHRSGICSINKTFTDNTYITTYTNLENKFQISVIETSNGTIVTLSYYVMEQEREAIKIVTINQ